MIFKPVVMNNKYVHSIRNAALLNFDKFNYLVYFLKESPNPDEAISIESADDYEIEDRRTDVVCPCVLDEYTSQNRIGVYKSIIRRCWQKSLESSKAYYRMPYSFEYPPAIGTIVDSDTICGMITSWRLGEDALYITVGNLEYSAEELFLTFTIENKPAGVDVGPEYEY